MSGGPSLKLTASFAGAHGKTTRGRDFAFWGRVFAGTRYMRIAQAERMAVVLGLWPGLAMVRDGLIRAIAVLAPEICVVGADGIA